MGIDTAIAIGAIAIAVFSLLVRMTDKSVSIREHEEFRRYIQDRFQADERQIERDVNRIESRLLIIEQTRPTTAELQAQIKGQKANA